LNLYLEPVSKTCALPLPFAVCLLPFLPVGDLGIVKAVQRAYGLRLAPTPVRLTRLGENWRPYRSVACWYLRASLDNNGS
jgi:DNA-3-methyladenine glycosylase II